MSGAATRDLSPLDWLMPRSYINHIICFPSSSPSVSQTLRQGLASTLVDVPYLTSEIVGQKYPGGSVALSENRASVDDLFCVKDLCPVADYKDLRAQDFHPSSFKGLDRVLRDSVFSGNRAPVFRAMLLLLNDGFVLSVSVHHSTTDITGFGVLLKIWASHCNSHSSQPIGFSSDWLDRRALFPMSDGTPNPTLINLPTLLRRENVEGVEKSEAAGADENLDHLETMIFKYSGDFLRSLKDEVIKHVDTDEVPWISTSDVLYGLLWGAVTYAEDHERMGATSLHVAERGTLHHKEVRRMRIPVNVRSRLRPSLPQNYIGSAFAVSLATVEKADLDDITKSGEGSIAALARVAVAIRKSILTVDSRAMKDVLTFLAAQNDLTGIKLGQQATDLSIVSWADENVYELDWGKEIGQCEAVRVSTLKKKRYPVILPRRLNGDLEFFACFEKSTMGLFGEVLVSYERYISQVKK
ncbi:hypothetical protein NW762_008902 [Fusarium torreyae]|uniref:Uncharacterized protein n=1 Tax=Fusarium torreyae TaxID=1237075 RepID=A0A9W8RW75_9HYPO|nr:hypothetical protein NW762_008902 [Fusarium torreyae]